MKIKKKVISFALAIALSLSAGATGITQVNALGKAPSGKTYKPIVVNHAPTKKVDSNGFISFNLGSDPPSLDSSSATDAVSFEILVNANEGLTRQEWDKKGNLVSGPGAAEKWEVSPDGLTWTFYLKKLNWSDGKPVTAKDFECSWLRVLDPNIASEYAQFLYFIKGAEEFNKKQGSIKDVGIRALSQTKFEVKLKRPTPYFERILSFGILLPIRKDVATKLGDRYGTSSAVKDMVWCGPYTVDSWKLGQKIVLKKNPKYWDAKKVQLSEVRFNLAQLETSTTVQMFQQKQLDFIGATKNYIDPLKKEASEGKFKFQEDTAATIWYLNYNHADKKGIFKNEKIRKAFGLAINREQFCKVVFNRNIPAYTFVPAKIAAGNIEYRKTAKIKTFKDLYKEYPTKNEWKNLLVEGLKELKMDTDPSKLEVEFLERGSTADAKTRQEFLQNQWQSNLGVKVKLRVVADFGTFLKEEQAGNFQLALNGWGPDYNDPLTYLDLFKTGNGNFYGKYSNKEADQLIAKISTEMNMDKRTKLCAELEQKMLLEAVVAPLYSTDIKRCVHNYVNEMGFFDVGADRDYKYAYTSGRK